MCAILLPLGHAQGGYQCLRLLGVLRAEIAELRTKLQLQEEELNDDDLEQAKADMLAAKAGLLEERERMREALKAKFDAYAHGKKK